MKITFGEDNHLQYVQRVSKGITIHVVELVFVTLRNFSLNYAYYGEDFIDLKTIQTKPPLLKRNQTYKRQWELMD